MNRSLKWGPMMKSKINIVIIDYGIGNVKSVSNAISYLGYNRLNISSQEQIIKKADVLILPGVGAFDEAIRNLKSRNLEIILNEQVLLKKKPILGICVGMQMFVTNSEENGIHNGLNWIKGNVKKLKLLANFSIPHVGWNNVIYKSATTIFNRNSDESNFYFDHSYHVECDVKNIVAYCNYGIKITAAIQQENIFGVQFHPEKSHISGLKMFRGFLNSI